MLGKTLSRDNLTSTMLITKKLFLPVLTLAAFLAGGTLCSAQTAEPSATPAAASGDAKPAPKKKVSKKKKDESATTETKADPAKDTSKPLAEQAPGGGPGMVWVNQKSKVYHTSESRYYGRTKDGKYMTEEEAKTMGAHPAGTGGKKKQAKKE